MSPTSPRLSRLIGTGSDIGAGTDITLQIGPDPGADDAGEKWRVKVKLQRIKLEHIIGTAANFTPAMFSVSGGVLTEIEQEYLGAVTAVTALFDATDIQGYCYTDTRGRLYLRPTPDAGAGNAFDYAVYFELMS